MKLCVLLVAVYSFTLPAMQSFAGCGAGPDSVRDSIEWSLSERVQSTTYVAMAPAMKIDAGVWAVIWPIVRREAEPYVVASGIGRAGAEVDATVRDTVGQRFVSVTSRNGRGRSCESNVIGGK